MEIVAEKSCLLSDASENITVSEYWRNTKQSNDTCPLSIQSQWAL